MNNLFEADTLSTILKWTATILITGFVAQFGKKFANFIAEKARNLRKKKSMEHTAVSAPEGVSDIAESRTEQMEKELKLQKKKVKARIKKEKKKLP